MKQFVWMSFDLGVRGDYEGIYQFLAARSAKECGDSVAGFTFEFKKDLISELTKELKAEVQLDKRSRVYLIFSDGSSNKYKGRFLVGQRKPPPWAGYAAYRDDEEDNGG